MPDYLYEAMDASGCEVADRIDAANETDARAQLRARGYFVTRLQAISSGSLENESHAEPQDVSGPDDSGKWTETSPRRQHELTPRWFWSVLGSLFLILGCVFLYTLGVRPLWGILQASGWEETPCTILASNLKQNPSNRNGSYRIEIVYRYQFEGRTYQSDRYDFVTITSNTNVAHRQNIVREHPPGKETVCFVNPANPAEAVLERGWTSEMWWGLFPIPFVLIGVIGLLFGTGVCRLPAKARRE